jgi:hypothetical protein
MAACQARRLLEDLMRADEVKGLESLEDHEDGAALIHSFTLMAARQWRQRHLAHDLRHGYRRCQDVVPVTGYLVTSPVPEVLGLGQ